MSDEVYEIQKSRLVLAGVFFLACALAFIFLGDADGVSSRRGRMLADIPFARPVLVGLCLAFIAAVVAAIVKDRPNLSAGPQGLRYQKFVGALVELNWSDVQEISPSANLVKVRYRTSEMTKDKTLSIGGPYQMKAPELALSLSQKWQAARNS